MVPAWKHRLFLFFKSFYSSSLSNRLESKKAHGSWNLENFCPIFILLDNVVNSTLFVIPSSELKVFPDIGWQFLPTYKNTVWVSRVLIGWQFLPTYKNTVWVSRVLMGWQFLLTNKNTMWVSRVLIGWQFLLTNKNTVWVSRVLIGWQFLPSNKNTMWVSRVLVGWRFLQPISVFRLIGSTNT